MSFTVAAHQTQAYSPAGAFARRKFFEVFFPHPLCWGCKILVLSRLPAFPPSAATSALGAGWAVGPSLVAGFFENFARSRKIAPNAHFLKEF